MAEKLVVAINGTAGSVNALNWAINRSKTVEVALELVSVIEIEPVVGWPSEDEVLPAYEAILLDAAHRVAIEAPNVDVTTWVRRGPVRRELLLAAIGSDLLVIGTREPTGYFSGTLRHHLAAEASCAVAVVPSGWQPSGGSIVVGIGSDETSAPALEFAAREADRLSRTLEVVHAWQPPVSQILQWLSAGADPSEQIEADHQRLLDNAVNVVAADFSDVATQAVLRRGNPAIVLTDAAESASAVVIGTHRRGLMTGVVLGSVGHDMLMSMPSTVLVVPTAPVAPQ